MLMACTSIGFAANGIQYECEAEQLQDLGLFKGTNNGFELERQPTRAEAGVMLIRMLGKEALALSQDSDYPFDDVPDLIDDSEMLRLAGEDLIRDDMAHFSFNLLKTDLKDSEIKLVKNQWFLC
jgi:hypothetical protein